MRGTEGDDEIPSIAAPPAGCEEEEGLLGGGNTKQEEESGVRAWWHGLGLCLLIVSGVVEFDMLLC